MGQLTAKVRDAPKRDYERDNKRLTWADVAASEEYDEPGMDAANVEMQRRDLGH
ncbi:hypothetical protein [Sphingomonas sp. GV3]|uniref:hypothetical protein n=1 Tax=Sphingomonas sp. GV3 TaxID=3040671 RepID=UPI00280BFA1E|nr:hypothetical protein [Sphingomonas sp. GV3]